MTTTLETYRAALEHIRDGCDAVCTECGWMGTTEQALYENPECPKCKKGSVRLGAYAVAAYALAQVQDATGSPPTPTSPKTMRETLAWYANLENYEPQGMAPSEIELDAGTKARAALEAVKNDC